MENEENVNIDDNIDSDVDENANNDNDPHDEDVAPQDEADQEEEYQDIISIDGETVSPDDENELVEDELADLREENKKLKEGTSTQEPQQRQPSLTKPELEDFEYDVDEYSKAMEAWVIAKLEQEQKVKSQEKEWEEVLSSYHAEKTKLKVKGYEVAELVVGNTLTVEQQAILLRGAKNAPALVYALGVNKKKLDEISSIKDPVKFAFAISDLQSKMKVEKSSTPPPPERRLSGSANGSAVDSTLEALRREAERTGDFTKVIQYKKQMRSK